MPDILTDAEFAKLTEEMHEAIAQDRYDRDGGSSIDWLRGEGEALLASHASLLAERNALLAFLREGENIGSFRDPNYQEQFMERHRAWLARADAVLGTSDETEKDVRWWNQFDADYEALRNDPVAWEEEQGERALLENTLMDGLGDE